MLPKVAFTGFASRYMEPRLQEGFQDIFRVDFKVRLAAAPAQILDPISIDAYR
jgi:hypothetical protein